MNDLINIARQNYDKVIQYHKSIDYDTKLNIIWFNNMTDIKEIYENSKTAEELIQNIDQTFMYAINFPPELAEGTYKWKSINDNPKIREKLIDWLLKKQEVNIFDLPPEIQESKFIHERNKIIRNGKVLSGNFLRTLSIANRIFKKVHKSEIKHILELGGGCGHQARTFQLLNPCKYTIIDLPETLVFSFTYLNLNFPEKKHLFVTKLEDLNYTDEYDFIYVPAVFADKLWEKSYNLFINTASMGEMKNEVIHYWMGFIQGRIKLNYLFTLNRYLNVIDKSHEMFRMFENECSVSYDYVWEIMNWEIEPIYCRCPFIDTLHSRYLEIFAKRPNNYQHDPKLLVKKSYELINDVLDEDWIRLKEQIGNGVMQQRNNLLNVDTTMEGTLFKLWNSIRLDQNYKNVELMIQYLQRITTENQQFQFEEMIYYKNLLERLPK